jgi:hypothetical protein
MLILANTVNELMLATPTVAHSTGLFASAARKLWIAKPGNLVVTPRQPSAAFVSYVCDVLQIDPGEIELITTAGKPDGVLARDILASGSLLTHIQHFCRAHPDAELLCYALDAPTLHLAHLLGIRPAGYSQFPNTETCEAINRLNTKSGFRAVALQLGLPVVDGTVCIGVSKLRGAVFDLLARHPCVRIKLDRCSNAHGQATLAADDLANVAEAIERQIGAWQDQPAEFVVECEIEVTSSPSIELTVGADGVSISYFCLQRYRRGDFSGMIADANSLDRETLASISAAGVRVGEYLRDCGYRGVFDLDAVVARGGEIYFTETNVRRTAGTFIHELVSRIAGPDGVHDRVWISDRLPAAHGVCFDAGLAAIRGEGLEYNANSRNGVLLTSDSVEVDDTWRYLILAENHVYAEMIENMLIDALPSLHVDNYVEFASPGHRRDTR